MKEGLINIDSKIEKAGSNPVGLEPPITGGLISSDLFDKAPLKSPNRSIDVNLTPNSFGYDKLEGNDDGLVPFVNQENTRAYNQSFGEKLANAVPKFVGTVATTVAETFTDPIYGGAKALTSGKVSELYDNEISRSYDDLNNWLAEQFPHYASDEEKQAGFLKGLTYQNFWTNTIPNGGAFLVGSYLATLATAGLGSIGKGQQAGKYFKALDKLMKANKVDDVKGIFQSGTNVFDKILKAAKNLPTSELTGVILPSAMGAIGESAVEARGIKTIIADQLRNERELGVNQYSDEEIEEIASSAGNTAFGMNMAIVGGSNIFQFGNMLRSMTGERKALASILKQGDQYVTPGPTALGKTLSVIGTPVEEAFQEGSQYTVEKGLEHYYSRYDKNAKKTVQDMIGSAIEGMKQTVGTKAGLESLFVGGLLGLFGVRGDIREYSQKYANTQSVLDTLNQYKFNGVFKNLYDTAITHAHYQNKKDKALQDGDWFGYKNAASDQFYSYIQSRIDNDMFDDVVDDIENLARLDKDQLKNVYGINEEVDTKTLATNLVKKAKEVKQINDNIDLEFGTKRTINGKVQDVFSPDIRRKLKYLAYGVKNAESRRNELQNELQKDLLNSIDLDKYLSESLGDIYNNSPQQIMQVVEGLKNTPVKSADVIDNYLSDFEVFKDESVRKGLLEPIRKYYEQQDPIVRQRIEQTRADIGNLNERVNDFLKTYNALLDSDVRITEEQRSARAEEDAQQFEERKAKEEVLLNDIRTNYEFTHNGTKKTAKSITTRPDGLQEILTESGEFVPVYEAEYTKENELSNYNTFRKKADDEAKAKIEAAKQEEMAVNSIKEFVKQNGKKIKEGKLFMQFEVLGADNKYIPFSGKVFFDKKTGFKVTGLAGKKRKTFTPAQIKKLKQENKIRNWKFPEPSNQFEETRLNNFEYDYTQDSRGVEIDSARSYGLETNQKKGDTPLFSTTSSLLVQEEKVIGEKLKRVFSRDKDGQVIYKDDLSQKRWSSFIETMPESEVANYELRLVGNGTLVNGIDIFNDLEKELDKKSPIIKAVVYKDGIPVFAKPNGTIITERGYKQIKDVTTKQASGLVYTSIPDYKGDDLTKYTFNKGDMISRGLNPADHVAEFKAFREKTLNAIKNGENVFVKPTGLQKGYPIREALQNEVRPLLPVEGRLSNIKLVTTPEINKRTGFLYGRTENGVDVQLNNRMVSEQEADVLIDLLQYHFSKPKGQTSTLVTNDLGESLTLDALSYVRSQVFFGKQELPGSFEIYFQNGKLYYGGEGAFIPLSKIEENRIFLRNFLMQKYIQADKKLFKDNAPFEYITNIDKATGQVTTLKFETYKEYLLSNNNRQDVPLPFGTDVVLARKKDEPNYRPQTVHGYINFKHSFALDKTKTVAKPAVVQPVETVVKTTPVQTTVPTNSPVAAPTAQPKAFQPITNNDRFELDIVLPNKTITVRGEYQDKFIITEEVGQDSPRPVVLEIVENELNTTPARVLTSKKGRAKLGEIEFIARNIVTEDTIEQPAIVEEAEKAPEVEILEQIETPAPEVVAVVEEPVPTVKETQKPKKEKKEVVEEPQPVKRPKPSKFTNPDDAHFKLLGDGRNIGSAELEKVRTILSTDIDIQIVQHIIDNKAMGKFTRAGIEVYEKAVEGTAFHEAFHAVFNLYHTSNDRAKLYDLAAKRYNAAREDEYALEELMADEFGDYALTEQIKGDNSLVKFFKKLWNIIKSIFVNQDKLESLFSNIYQGGYRNAQIINEYDTVKYALLPGKDLVYTDDMFSLLNYHLFTTLFAEGGIDKLSDGNVLTNFYNEFYEDFVLGNVDNTDPKEAIYADYVYMRDNYDTIIKEHTKRLEIDGIISRRNDTTIEQEATVNPEELVDSTNETPDDIELEGTRNRSEYLDSFKVNYKDLMSNNVKYTLYTLPDYEGNKWLRTSLNSPKLVNPNKIYAQLMDAMSGLTDIEKMYEKLDELSNQSKTFAILKQRLKGLNDSLTLKDIELQNSFRQVFAKAGIDHINTIIEDEKVYNVSTSNNSAANVIISTWKDNLLHLAEESTNPYVNMVEGVVQIDLGKLLSEKDNEKFLSALGINFTNKAAFYNDTVVDAINGLRYHMEKQNPGYIPYDDKTITGRMTTLAQYEAIFNTSGIVDNNFISLDGKRIYKHTLHNYITLMNYAIANSATRQELFKNYPELDNVYTKNSRLLYGHIYDASGTKTGRKLTTRLLAGVKEATSQGTKTSNLSIKDKITQDVVSLLFNGQQAFLRASDKSSEFAFETELIVPSNLPDPIRNGLVGKTIEGYIKDEFLFAWTVQHRNDYAQNIDQLTNTITIGEDKVPKYLSFGIFQEILSPNTHKLLREKLFKKNLPEDFMYIKGEGGMALMDIVKQETYAYLKKQSEANMKLFTDNNVLDKRFMKTPDAAKLSKQQIVDAFTVNYWINATEQVKLITGNLNFYKDFFKRTSGATGTKKIPRVDPYINKWLNQPENARADGKEADGKVNSIVLTGTKHISRYIGNFTEYLTNKGLSQYDIDTLLAPYKDIDEQDAQGYISLDEYREIMIRIGQNAWSSKHEWAYQRMKSGKPLRKDDVYYFQPLKLQYFGPNQSELEQRPEQRLYVPTFYKFALMPLLPEFLSREGEQTTLGRLNDIMRKKQIGIALFDSANKVGRVGNTPFYNNTGTALEPGFNEENIINQIIDYKYLGIQLDIAAKIKTENTVGTQQQKLVWTNQQGEITTANGKKDIEELKAEYDSIYNKIIESKYNTLRNELGIGDEYTYSDLSNIKQLLKQQGIANKLDDDFFEAINNAESLDTNKYRARIEQMLFSIAKSRVVNLKRNGGAKIQVSSVGLETERRMLENGMTLDTHLDFYSYQGEGKQITKAEIAVALPEELIDYVESIGGLDQFNRRIADGKVDEKLLTYYGYRIPTDDMHAIDVLKVKYFLPRTSGEVVVVPPELVAKVGSDFDVDKLNIFQPYLNVDGKNITLQTEGEAGLWNQLQEIAQSVILAPENFEYLISPTTTDPLKEQAKAIRRMKGLPEDVTKLSNTKTIEYGTVLDMGKNFWSGKAGVGIAAVYRTFHTLATNSNLVYEIPQPKYPSNYDELLGGIKIGKIKDKAGRYISANLGMYINAYVDVAKDPFVFDLGASTAKANILFKFVLEGVPLEYYTAFLNQPIVNEYIEALANNKSVTSRRTSKKKVLENLRGKYQRMLSQKFTPQLYDNGTLESMLNPERQNGNDYALKQLTILDDYLKYEEEALELASLVRATTDDTKGGGLSFAENFVILQNKDKVKAISTFTGYDSIYENKNGSTMMGAFNKYGLLEVSKLFDDLFLSRKGNNRAVLDSIAEKIYNENVGDFDIVRSIDRVYKEFFNFIIQQGDDNVLTKDYVRLFQGKDSVANRLLKLKNNPKFERNYVIRELTLIPTEDFTYIKMFNRRKSAEDLNKLKIAFKELYNDNPTFAMDLARLGILQSGIANSPITFVDIIPSELFNKLTEQQITKFMSGENTDAQYFEPLVHINNSSDTTLVKSEEDDAKYVKTGDVVRDTQTGKSYPAAGNGIYLKQYMKKRFPLAKNLGFKPDFKEDQIKWYKENCK